METKFWDFLMLYQIFLSPQVKQSTIISNKHGVYEFPHEFPNDLRSKISKLARIINKCLAIPPKRKIFQYQPKTAEKRNWTFLVRRYFTWKLEFVSNIFWMIVENILNTKIFIKLPFPEDRLPVHLPSGHNPKKQTCSDEKCLTVIS